MCNYATSLTISKWRQYWRLNLIADVNIVTLKATEITLRLCVTDSIDLAGIMFIGWFPTSDAQSQCNLSSMRASILNTHIFKFLYWYLSYISISVDLGILYMMISLWDYHFDWSRESYTKNADVQSKHFTNILRSQRARESDEFVCEGGEISRGVRSLRNNWHETGNIARAWRIQVKDM